MTEGIIRDNDRLFDVGLYTNNFVAPAMYIGALIGPSLPKLGEWGISAVAKAWQAMGAGANAVSGGLASGANATATMAREVMFYVMTHPYEVMKRAHEVADVIGVFCESPIPPTTKPGVVALMIKYGVEHRQEIIDSIRGE